MSVEQNKATARRVYEEIFNRGDLKVIDRPFDMAYRDHAPMPTEPDADGFKQHVRVFRAAFPDIAFTVEDILGEGEEVAVRWSARGTPRDGSLVGRPVTMTGIAIMRFADGKIVESWVNRNSADEGAG